MSWFKRIKEGITTATHEKKETPEGLWYKCNSCKSIIPAKEHSDNLWVCVKCGYHERIGSAEYFHLLFDDNKFEELNAGLKSADPLSFVDTKKYKDRLAETQRKTGLNDALRTASAKWMECL
jgi:acetyl-CoA carboxylase carboxyl transferase subunit beta